MYQPAGAMARPYSLRDIPAVNGIKNVVNPCLVLMIIDKMNHSIL